MPNVDPIGAERDPTKRFSSRVENYVKYRPGYPAELVPLLRRECGLTSESVVADIGSGTGKLTELFVENGNRVFAVEPNAEMRSAAERLLAHYPNFQSVNGAAEATNLPARSAHLIVSGQAFHWFNHLRARKEFARILNPGGWVALFWNERRTSASPFLRAYDEVVQSCAMENRVDHSQVDAAAIKAFFAPNDFRTAVLEFQQVFDFEGLKGRLLSSSYAPEPGHAKHAPMIEKLRAVFDYHERNGRVVFDYDTRIYYGRFD